MVAPPTKKPASPTPVSSRAATSTGNDSDVAYNAVAMPTIVAELGVHADVVDRVLASGESIADRVEGLAEPGSLWKEGPQPAELVRQKCDLTVN